MEYIKLKKSNILKFGLMDEDGNIKKDKDGNEVYLEFDLEDINLIDNYNNAIKGIKKAYNDLKNTKTILDKKEDITDDGEILSRNQKKWQKALKEYYAEIEKSMDLFLGKGGLTKIFGERRYLTMMEDLTEMLQPILPKIKVKSEDIKNHIVKKYSKDNNDILSDEELS